MIEIEGRDIAHLSDLLNPMPQVRNMAIQWMKLGLGKATVDEIENPSVILYQYKIFNFLGGDVSSPFASDALALVPSMRLLLPSYPEWASYVRKAWGGSLRTLQRIRLSPSTISLKHITKMKEMLPQGFRIRRLTTEILEHMPPDLLGDMHLFFQSADDYLSKGFGYCILCGSDPVSVARTCFPYISHFEVQVNTLREYRRMGLATCCSAALIEEGLRRNLVPDWDAANEESVSLAMKLGYSQPIQYEVFYRASEMKGPSRSGFRQALQCF